MPTSPKHPAKTNDQGSSSATAVTGRDGLGVPPPPVLLPTTTTVTVTTTVTTTAVTTVESWLCNEPGVSSDLQACLQVLYFSFSLHPLLQTSIGNPVGFLSSLCVCGCVCVCVGGCVCVYVGLCGCVSLFLFWGSGCATVKGEMVGG